MRTNPYEAYIDDEILNAEPLKLVQLMYQGMIDAVTSARASLARRDIKARSRSITKAILILTELSSSLNHEKGGELSARLAALYDYMQRRLLEANQKQVDPPLAEVAQLLQTLFEAWETIAAAAPLRKRLFRSGSSRSQAKSVCGSRGRGVRSNELSPIDRAYARR